MPKPTSFAPVGICLTWIALLITAPAALADNYDMVVERLRDGKLPQALAVANRHLARHPLDPQMRFLKGVIQHQAGKLAEAAVTYDRLVQSYPELAEAHHNLAVVYLAQGHPDKALVSFEAAKRASRSHAVTYEKLAVIYEELARQTYTQVLRLEDGGAGSGPGLAPIRQLIRLPTQTGRSTLDPLGGAPSPGSGKGG